MLTRIIDYMKTKGITSIMTNLSSGERLEGVLTGTARMALEAKEVLAEKGRSSKLKSLNRSSQPASRPSKHR